MHAFIAAGGRPGPDDPLYPYTQGGPRSLVDVAGKPMLQWVLDAIAGAESIDEIIIVGIAPESGLETSKRVHYIADQGDMLSNAKLGLERVRRLQHVSTHALYASSDIPAITPEIVEWRLQAAMEDESDMDYAAIERAVMEDRFPGSNRTYVRLRNLEVCGSDMNIIRLEAASREDIWRRLVAARKSPLRQAALLGFETLFLLLLGRLTLERGERLASRRLGIKGRIRLSPYAEIGMDVDKPYQLEILRKDLAARGPGAA